MKRIKISRLELTRNTRHVCLIGKGQTRRVVHFGEDQPCKLHAHIKREYAEHLVANGEAEWAGKAQNVLVRRQPLTEPNGEFKQARAMWNIVKFDEHQEVQGGLVSPR